MTRFEVAPGFSLNVECEGAGEPIVLLHGFTGSAESWGEFGHRLAQRFRTLAVDFVGHGASDSPVAIDHYRMDQVVADLVRLVALLGYRRAHWLGYSMGGRTALQVAAACPDAVDRLVLIGASAGLADAGERAARVVADEALAARIERDGVEAFVDYWERLPLFATQQRLAEETRQRVRAGRLACNAVGLANSLRGMGTGAQAPLQAALGRIAAETLVVAGEEDTKFAGIGQELAAAMPRARFLAVPGVGHAAQLEAPLVLANTVLAFLERGVGE